MQLREGQTDTPRLGIIVLDVVGWLDAARGTCLQYSGGGELQSYRALWSTASKCPGLAAPFYKQQPPHKTSKLDRLSNVPLLVAVFHSSLSTDYCLQPLSPSSNIAHPDFVIFRIHKDKSIKSIQIFKMQNVMEDP